ncbi:hypothetical protein C3K47_16610 [Solitalea longa]|uniref:Tetratricopeptide repeat protein n=1 Tax=Solitalea longa TaxID=2079460 RepID=A0A2S4ZXV9_9SPHI|nr:tetratricopeptide repeat protein [Solitalea longa]POY35201.1 hypothetical protein C3K47_16610 [Solitalea longa]
MKKVFIKIACSFFIILLSAIIACNPRNKTPSNESILDLNLKQGEIAVCGPADKQFGLVGFGTSCSPKVQKDFDLAMALLHSFEYDEAEKVFAKVIEMEPDCGMAYWGVAMSNYHPLWTPPTLLELEKGTKAILIARSIKQMSKRESAYIDAIAGFYEDWEKVDHHARSVRFEKGMEKVYRDFPEDNEAAIFYALSLVASASPADKSFKNQKLAGSLLKDLYSKQPNHPGIVHYIIHAYDYPQLAALALPAAKEYSSIAPSSAHALHMPSHIFIRLGLWQESINSNLASISSAQCYAEQMKMKGHWDEEVHGLDYLVYAYLQKGENIHAKSYCDYLDSIKEVEPVNFKVAYAFAAVPSRYVLENQLWDDAANLKVWEGFPWKGYPWQRAIIHFTRLLGSVHTGQLNAARIELKTLYSLHDTLENQKDVYKADQVLIQIKASQAWLLLKEGKQEDALKMMRTAADMESKTQKHPVTPGEVLPASELLGDMLLEINRPTEALQAYEVDLKQHPKRFNGLYGAGQSAKQSNEIDKAAYYFQQLIAIAPNSNRDELKVAKAFLEKNKLGI